MSRPPYNAPAQKGLSGENPALGYPTVIGSLFFSVLLMVLGVIGYIVWQAENAQYSVRQSIEARTAAEALISAIRDAELQQRNLIISDEPDYRTRLELALARIPVELSRLLAESDDITQERRLGTLADLVSRRMTEIQDVVNELARSGEEPAFEALKRNEQRTTMATIADMLREFDAEEDRIQIARENRESQVRIWLLPALIAALASTCGLGWMWIRQERALSAVLSNVNRTLELQVRDRTAELEEERRRVEALLTDMTHRIGNSLAMVSSFLALEARRSKDANVKEALDEANRRVAAIASAQRRLRISSDRDEVSLAGYLCDLVQDIRATVVGHRVSLRIDVTPVTINSHDAVAVGIVLNELVTNALKHAFSQDQDGLIRVTLTREGGKVILSVADDGIGIDAEAASGDHSLGFLVVRSMVASVRGDLSCQRLDKDAALPGTEWRLSFEA
jgi:two-component sensor histidine kinase